MATAMAAAALALAVVTWASSILFWDFGLGHTQLQRGQEGPGLEARGCGSGFFRGELCSHVILYGSTNLVSTSTDLVSTEKKCVESQFLSWEGVGAGSEPLGAGNPLPAVFPRLC